MRCIPSSVDVFVVGGGPAGLAASIAARRRGMSVVVADGAIPPIDKACGEGLMPDGLAALHELGIEIPGDEAYPFRGIRFVSGERKVEAEFAQGMGYGMRRTTLHRILVEHAASCGVCLLWNRAITGLDSEEGSVRLAGARVRARWIVGADGTNSRVRRWARIGGQQQKKVRFGFRRHYRVAPWSDFMELYWGGDGRDEACQIYVTPVGREEVCVALISSNPAMRVDAALAQFPELAARIGGAEAAERGAITVNRKLGRVYRGRTVLVGDASGGVDAITGEGLCLAFREAALLADCLSCGNLAAGNLARYQVEHRRLMRRPTLMAELMLLMSNHRGLRQRTMQVFERNPRLFAGMLAMHVGEGSARDYVANGISMGWRLLTA